MLLLATLLFSRNNSREAGIQAEGVTASYKQMENVLPPTSYDVLKAGKELSFKTFAQRMVQIVSPVVSWV